MSLAVAIALMFAVTIDPRLLVGADGRADHSAALLVFWAMSAGFVRGVGFVPRVRLARLVFSAAGQAAALAGAVLLRIGS